MQTNNLSDMPELPGVYRIVNEKTNMCYVGESNNINKRINTHFSNLKNNNHHSYKLQNSYNKSKDKNIFIVDVLELVAEENLKEREKHYIDKFDSFYNGYNCRVGFLSYKHVEKIRKMKLTNDLCETFKILYEDTNSTFGIGRVFLERLIDKHYKPITYKKVIGLMLWFMENYSIDNHSCNLYANIKNSICIDIHDKHTGGVFATYIWMNDGVCIDGESMGFLLSQYEIKYGTNPDIHYLIDVHKKFYK